MANYDGDDFHPSIEPMVIINSQDDEEENSDFKDNSQLPANDNDFSSYARPEISIFPVKKNKRASFKIKFFEKHVSNGDIGEGMSGDEEETNMKIKNNVGTRSPGVRTPVRLISKDEALNAEETYTRRKSSPLEKCPICKKFFRRMKTHLLKHEIVETTIGNGLVCEMCSKAFNSQTNLQIHMRTHTGQRPYICDVCNKSFSQSCNLVNHMRVHTGEKPFKCPHCDRAFTQSGNLNNHIRLHTDEKPFKCHFCEKAFVQSGNLNSHIRNNHRFKGFAPIQGEVMNNRPLNR
ncbi:zinc finger protein 391-like isoform X2 [Sitophilus oryzae]|uniref:Protein krueppel n=1 Tax=Sitophilus oryzae TaxID=7048 RepID=A0A6J2Y5J9_SITOR|nr:zinc finger protein 391-like isoform X2 [Sitophilus oryzae]